MKTSQKGIELIKQFEGLRTVAYKDTGGVWTIGYGHTGGVKSNDKITPAVAEMYLREDLKTAEKAVNMQMLNINQNQFDALVSFVFNVGSGNFIRSTLLKKAKQDPDDPSIRNEFLKWVYAGGKRVKGLEKRRKAEADLYFR